jgi:hypothetical protein
MSIKSILRKALEDIEKEESKESGESEESEPKKAPPQFGKESSESKEPEGDYEEIEAEEQELELSEDEKLDMINASIEEVKMILQQLVASDQAVHSELGAPAEGGMGMDQLVSGIFGQ